MKVVILGAGRVGYSIAQYLSSEENHISVVDTNPHFLKKMSDGMDIQTILGFASHPDVLEEAGARDAELLIAVTASDEVNIVACEVAQDFNVTTKVARLRSASYLSPLYAHLFCPPRMTIDHIISPELEVAKSISKSLQMTGSFHAVSLLDEEVLSLGILCPSKAPILNTPFRLLSSLFPNLFLSILCIARKGRVFIPDGDDQLFFGDEVHLLCDAKQKSEISEAFALGQRENRRVLILGGGNIGLSLAKSLENNTSNIACKLIERDHQRAENAAQELKNTEVLWGDGLENDVLKEANITTCEAIISVTDDDRVNILSSLLGKNMGARRAMALLNNIGQASFAASLGVDAVINPSAITVSTILEHIRQGRLHSVHSLRDGFAELIEAHAKESSIAVGLAVEDIMMDGNILVAAIAREGEIIFMPPKHTFIRIEDKLVILSTKSSIKKLERLFSLRA